MTAFQRHDFQVLRKTFLDCKTNKSERVTATFFGDLRLGKPRFSRESIKNVNRALAAISEISRRYDLEVGQFAAAWILSRYDKSFVLCGARTPEHALSNAMSGDALVSSEDMEEVDSILKSFELLEN